MFHAEHNVFRLNSILCSEYSYIPWIHTITIGEKPSILSTLHEIGHAIRGSKELNACVFSIALFKMCFPEEFKNLEWKGHVLIRKKS